MKKQFVIGVLTTLISGASIASDLPSTKAPVQANAPVRSSSDAYASILAGYRWVGFEAEGQGADIEGNMIGGRFSGSHQFQNNFGLQVDGTAFRNSFEYTTLSEYDGALHAYLRSQNYLIGVIGQLGQSNYEVDFGDLMIVSKSSPLSLGMNWNRYYAGVEGQVYLNNVTFYGQAAYEKTDLVGMWNEILPDANGWIITGQARYFLNPDFRVDALGSYTNRNFSNNSGELDLDIWTVGLGAEAKLPSTPFGVFGNVDYSWANYGGVDLGSSDLTYSNTRVLVGIKLNLGSDTLIERDRKGASLDPLPHIAQPIADLISAEMSFLP